MAINKLFKEEKKFQEKKALLETMMVVDIAENFEQLPIDEVIKLIRLLSKDKGAEVFAYLPLEFQSKIVERFTDDEIKSIIEELYADDAADLIEEMPANIVTRVLKVISHEHRVIINQLMNYPEDSIGSVMTVEFVSLRTMHTVGDALRIIKELAIEKETIYTCYVTSPGKKLIGVVEVKSLLTSPENKVIGDIMRKDFVKAITTDDKETLVHIFNKYPLIALPVTDKENRLVGIVTHDDAFRVIKEEYSEDFEMVGKLHVSDKPYLQEKTFILAKNRIVWLLVLMLSATITGFIITRFEASIVVIPALVSFIPMLMDTGGNAGSQASTLIIRGMALKEIKPNDGLKVFFKEIRVSLIVGVALAIINFVRVWIMYNIQLALVVSLTLIIVIFMAKTIGAMLPLLAKKLKLDPALMAAPLITTVVDAGALVMYFLIASLLLGIN